MKVKKHILLKQKLIKKFDITHMSSEELEIKTWIENVLDESLEEGRNLQEMLRDGIILCKLINKIFPDSCKFKINGGPFVSRENISNFLNVLKNRLKVPDYELFQSNDLLENKNFKQVIICIYAMNRYLRDTDFQGPFIGPKMSKKSEGNKFKNSNTNYTFVKEMVMNNIIQDDTLLFNGVPRQIIDLEEYRKDHKQRKDS